MGRNIFASDHPAAMIQAVRAIVHDMVKPQDAYEEYLTRQCAGRRREARRGGQL